MLVTTIGGGDTTWGDLPAYVIGPVVGGVLAALAYDVITRPREFDEPEPAQGTQGDIEGRRDPLERTAARTGARGQPAV
jgi:glycerol uptake facilitator protein